MSFADQPSIRNGLLNALRSETFAEFRPHLELVDLPIKHVLVEANQPTSHVCFIEIGLGSMVALNPDSETVEIGHIGREGMTGHHLALLTSQTPNRTFMQVAGAGYLMPASAFLSLLEKSDEVRMLFLNYVQTCELQLAHSALAYARYNVNQRLARWLLMMQDRLDSSDLPVTHEFLSLMLGVRRSGVTDQIHVLEGAHAIKATRGNIHVRNRAKLEGIAGGSYGVPEREYERLIGQSPRFRHQA
ncbi:CRP-like cAMP-binding protein [Rhizobium soli]|uniref:CRP-like cAMP-binding protein n=1 Tax=Rhizobium soli TaxID=424798 RepID=A0A7X0JNP9_9HYPH|nr:Crp/Fnr family transcriptional regulator [Rhizobium soli]MBB6510973.1 CRP-like cAMP-binding protein [Rhizobium soli]